MPEYGINEPYAGYNVLVSYLQKYNNVSYYGFLKRNRNVMVDTLSSSFDSQDLNITWSRNFLREAERLVQDKNILADMKTKVNLEHDNNRLRSFWEGVIKEHELRRELFEYENEKKCVLQTLHDLDDKIQTTSAQIAELINNQKEEDPLTIYNNFDQQDDYYNEIWRIKRRKEKSKAIINDVKIPKDLITDSGISLNYNATEENLDGYISCVDSDEDDPKLQERLKKLKEKYKENSRVYQPDTEVPVLEQFIINTSQEQDQEEIPQDDVCNDNPVNPQKQDQVEIPQDDTRDDNPVNPQEQNQAEIPQNDIHNDNPNHNKLPSPNTSYSACDGVGSGVTSTRRKIARKCKKNANYYYGPSPRKRGKASRISPSPSRTLLPLHDYPIFLMKRRGQGKGNA
ncbi:hypothetical protein GLOIN_2v1790294 [Rhizophagus clarus]|uniref:Uncharacterized protein n=1 Tax=Rhizophagus clarus TaxID=94130 RepID=A0A8H3QU49_9GLOM|nr:hypothetical protein GLOIN_2v1790294 [Rhizophagus clarus]